MLRRTPLLSSLSTLLLVVSNFTLAMPLAGGPQSEATQYRVSFGPLHESSADKYSLGGTVINSVTGEPIRAALVQIYFTGQSSMLTGPDGKFQFDGLPAGQTSINVRKPGFFSEYDFQPSAFRQRMVATGPHSSPVVVKLIPEGIIHGRISAEDGEPLEGLPVTLLEQSLQNGRKSWRQLPGAQADEDGSFRIAELPPGNYFLSAGPSRDPVAFTAKLPQQGAQGIPIVYYPVGSDISAAAPISITPGKKIEINFTIPSQPFYRVSGTVSGYSPGQPVSLQLHDSAGMFLPYNPSFDSATGGFRILGVPDGAYTLQAESFDAYGHTLTANVPLTVHSELSGIRAALLPTANIPIRISVITSRTGAERFSGPENYFPAYVQLVAHNRGMFENRYGSQQVGEKGASSLELPNIAAGTYTVEINTNGSFYVLSATSGTTDLLESDLSIAAGTSPQPIEITLRDDVASVTGKVSLDNQTENAVILAISEHASVPPRIQPTDLNGGFQLPFLPPGAYKILAVDYPDRIEYANPEAMKRYLSKAREITLSPDQSAKIDLELVKVGE